MSKDNTKQLEGKRGKKGGTQFPRFSLKHLESFCKLLASKTHTNTINIEQLSAGIFKLGSKTSTGKIKYSALKQFKLISGDYEHIRCTELGAQIALVTGEEKIVELQKAFNNISSFKDTLTTFLDSKIDKAKIGQYAVSTLKIHPDMKEEFMKVLIESAEFAQLCKIEGTTVVFSHYQEAINIQTDENADSDESDDSDENAEHQKDGMESDDHDQSDFNNSRSSKKSGQISNINVNIDVDPSMDPEKLEKLLKLLKNYGAI